MEKSGSPLLDIDKMLPILNRIALFGALSETQLYTVFRMLHYTQYSKGKTIFKQGEQPSHIYIVLSGCVHIVHDYKATPVELAELNVGDCFGETSVIGIQPHSASAVAMTDTELVVITRQALLDLYNNDSKLFGMLILNIAREACRRLNQTQETMLHYVMGE